MGNKVAVKKVKKLNPEQMQAVIAQNQQAAQNGAIDRFTRAEKVMEVIPRGLDTGSGIADNVAPSSSVSKPIFNISQCVVGSIVRVPMGMIDQNPVGARQIYLPEEVDKIGKNILENQEDATHGFVKNGRIQLIDGGTRFLAAQSKSKEFLDVKIEEEPPTLVDLFNRSNDLNNNRSDPSALDFALGLKKLMTLGEVKTAREIIQKIPAPGKRVGDEDWQMSEGVVSMYLRIAKLPKRITNIAVDSPEIMRFHTLYAISGLFSEDLSDEELDAREELANEVIDEIKRKGLNKERINDLVKAKLGKPKSRERGLSHPIKIGTFRGQIKVFENKGQLDLSLKGVPEDRLETLRERIEEVIKSMGEVKSSF